MLSLASIMKFRAWLFLAVLIAVFEICSHFLYERSFIVSGYNLRSLAVFAAIPLLLALGQTFVIISAGIDLSIGFVMGLAAVVTAHTTNYLMEAGMGDVMSALIGIVFACIITVVPGLFNGLLIARLGVPPFIGTLGMYGVARGVAFLTAAGITVPVSNSFLSFMGNEDILFMPVLVLIVIGFCFLSHYLLKYTKFGQHVYALGDNEAAASRSGVNIQNLTLKIYILAGFFAGVAGALYTARFYAGAAQAGEPLLLISVAIVVIGGASLFGGSGTITGTVAGALVIAVIQYGLVYINVEPFWQFIAVGVVIILSVLLDQFQNRAGSTR